MSISEITIGVDQVEQPPVGQTAKEGNGYSAPIIYKAFAILRAVAENPGNLGISDLSRNLNINKSTVFGVIQALLDLGALRQEEAGKKFSLGPALNQLSSQSMAGISLRALAWPYMEKLAHEFGQTVMLGRFHEYGFTLIGMAESPAAIRITSPVGTRIPFFAGAPGKVYLASLNEQSRTRIIEERGLPKFTERSITDPAAYLGEIEKTVRQGYAADVGEYLEGINSICVPMVDARGWMLAAIWVVGLSAGFHPETMAECAAAAKDVAAHILAQVQ